MKRCNGCFRTLSAKRFYPRPNRPGGLWPRCIACTRAERVARYQADPERELIRARAYRAARKAQAASVSSGLHREVQHA